MELTLAALEQALQPISDIGREELSFVAAGQEVTLRVMTPEQEAQVQRYSTSALSGEGDPSAEAVMSYLEKFKLATLSHSIVQVGALDFRDVEFVETGEKLDNGKVVKIPRYEAVRRILSKWPGGVRNTVFLRYYELLEKFERRVEQSIEYDPPDLDAEIERATAYLEKLKQSKDRKSTDIHDSFSKQVKAVATDTSDTAEEKRVDRRKATASQLGMAPDPVGEEEVAAPARTSIIPTQAEPPTHAGTLPDPPSEPETFVAEDTKPAAPYNPPPAMDSFVDVTDSDGLAAEAAAETARLVRMRRQSANAQPHTEVPSALTAVHETLREQQQPVQQAQHVGEHEGRPVYKMPTQDMTARAQEGPALAVDPRIDKGPKGDSRNPRFRKPLTP